MEEVETPAGVKKVLRDPTRGLFAPVVLILFLAVAAIVGLIWFATAQLDHNVETRDVALARTALETEAARMRFVARDYSWWDATIENLVDNPDEEWADDNIGSYALESSRVTVSGVIHVDGHTGSMFIDGVAAEGSLSDHLPADFVAWIADRANDVPLDNPRGIASFVNAGDLVYVVGAGAITPEEPEGADLEPHRRPVLLLASPLDEDFVSGLADAYLLDNLTVRTTLPENDQIVAPISDGSGWATAYLAWSARRPGTVMRQDLLLPVGIGALAMAVLTALYIRRLFRARAETDAISAALERERELRTIKSRFIATVSHEMRTPLAVIQAAADMLRHFGDKLSELERRQEIETICGRVSELDTMLSEALVIEKGIAQPVRPEVLDPATEIRDYWDRRVERKGQSLVIEDRRPDSSPAFRTDRRLFRQAVGNLIQNAVKYSPDNSEIRIEIDRTDRQTVITVVDHGIGIPAADLPFVTEPFSRGGNVENISGVGFGLSIVSQSVRLLGGELKIESEEGHGTRAALRLDDRIPEMQAA